MRTFLPRQHSSAASSFTKSVVFSNVESLKRGLYHGVPWGLVKGEEECEIYRWIGEASTQEAPGGGP